MADKKNIKFITDSASDIPKKYAEEKNIGVLPFHIYFRDNKIDTNDYLDGVNITTDKMFEIVEKGGGAPNSSQVTAYEIEEYLRKLFLANEYDTYIFTTLSSVASPIYRNVISAKEALEKEGLKFDLRVIDSMFYTVGYYCAVKAGIEAYENGAGADAVCEIIDKRCKETDIYLICDTLEYLKRGGRITGVSAAVGNILDIKPVLTVRGGLVAPFDKVRGMKKAMAKIIEIVKERTTEGEYDFMIVYSTQTDAAAAFAEAVKKEFNLDSVSVNQVGVTIGLHIGPGLVGLMFQKKYAL
jgi:DegV family protein with EDD domain